MDDNVMSVLKLLQEGNISAQEAEMLIAALRKDGGGSRPTPPQPPKPPEPPKPDAEAKDKKHFGGFDKIKAPKINLDDLGSRISQAVAKIQPEKIVKQVQSQLRTAARAGSTWSSSFQSRVWHWAEGEDRRPEKPENWHELVEEQELTFHLEPSAAITIENPLGNITVKGTATETSVVKIKKVVWQPFTESLAEFAKLIEISTHATDSRLDIKVACPEHFYEGVVDIEIEVPATSTLRVSSHYGEVEVEGIEGRVEAVTTCGDLKAQKLGGDFRGETVAGNIHIKEVKGTVVIATRSGDIHTESVENGITANAVSGDVHISKIEGGKVECKSVSGDAHASQIGLIAPLEIRVESVSGDVSLKEAKGTISLKAVSGDLCAEAIAATNIQAQTVSGDINLKLNEDFMGIMQVNTVSGDTNIGIPTGSSVRISLGTNSGELHCSHTALDVSSSSSFWTGQIGTGAGTLNVQTISGDVNIGEG